MIHFSKITKFGKLVRGFQYLGRNSVTRLGENNLIVSFHNEMLLCLEEGMVT